MSRQQLEALANYLAGFAEALTLKGHMDAARKIGSASELVRKFIGQICRHGIAGCTGGDTCTSDHK